MSFETLLESKVWTWQQQVLIIYRYERNIMIFDWLHTLDETATAAVEAAAAEKEAEIEK